MTKVATMGAFSCACIAIQGFKEKDWEMEETYRKTKKFKESAEGLNLREFYDEVLYPVEQPFGASKDYPFSLLMEQIDDGQMREKFTIAVLAEFQVNQWEPKLLKHGFTLIDKVDNEIGTINHIYTRNLGGVE